MIHAVLILEVIARSGVCSRRLASVVIVCERGPCNALVQVIILKHLPTLACVVGSGSCTLATPLLIQLELLVFIVQVIISALKR